MHRGTYSITLTAGTATRTITATVTGATPVLTVPEVRIIERGSAFNIFESVTAYSEGDGDISEDIVADPASIDTSIPRSTQHKLHSNKLTWNKRI